METRNGLIVYESKYGSTLDYARWLEQELGLAVFRTRDLQETAIQSSSFVIIGTPVYAGQFRIKSWLRQNTKILSSKKIFLFVVCNTTPDEQTIRERLLRNNLPSELKQFCEIYFLPGRLDISKLSTLDKLTIKLATLFEKNKIKKTAMRQGIDNVHKHYLIPLIKSVHSYCSAKLSLSGKRKFNGEILN